MSAVQPPYTGLGEFPGMEQRVGRFPPPTPAMPEQGTCSSKGRGCGLKRGEHVVKVGPSVGVPFTMPNVDS